MLTDRQRGKKLGFALEKEQNLKFRILCLQCSPRLRRVQMLTAVAAYAKVPLP